MMNSTHSERIALFAQPGIGEVVKAISLNQRGRVKFKATFWPAKVYVEARTKEAQTKPQAHMETLLPLEQVIVVGIDGITLLVKPLVSSAKLASGF